MRDQINSAMKDAMKAKDKTKLSTLRLISAAIKDRDIANRTSGKDSVSDDDVLAILAKMVKQREDSARVYEEGNRLELAEQERSEIVIINAFLPAQLSADEVEAAISAAIDESGAESLRDMGKVMGVLKGKFTGQMDFSKASAAVQAQLKARMG